MYKIILYCSYIYLLLIITRQHENADNPNLITELQGHLQVLFTSKSNTRNYRSLMQDLQNLWNISDSVVNTDGEVNTPEKFNVYHQCAIDLLTTLSIYIPGMLKNEDFFKSAFNM